MSRTSKLAAATAVAALAIPAAAQAHVTLQPSQAAAGAFTVLNVRVPTELDNASTAKVDVKFPDGFAAARYQNVPGWKVRVITKTLAQPIQTDDGPITQGIDRMVFARTSAAGGIKPGQFQDFPISVQIPGKAGDKLTFKAIQTYSNGSVVRWIGGSGAPPSPPPRPRAGGKRAVQRGPRPLPRGGGGGGGGGRGRRGRGRGGPRGPPPPPPPPPGPRPPPRGPPGRPPPRPPPVTAARKP